MLACLYLCGLSCVRTQQNYRERKEEKKRSKQRRDTQDRDNIDRVLQEKDIKSSTDIDLTITDEKKTARETTQ